MATKTITIEIDDTLAHALLIAKADYLHNNINHKNWTYVSDNVEALNALYVQIWGALHPKKG